MKKLKQTYLRSGRVIGAVLLLLMIVGSIWDLPIQIPLSRPGEQLRPVFRCVRRAAGLPRDDERGHFAVF